MSSSCLSGGCRPCGFDIEIVKSPSSTSTITTHSSSPSSTTLSESSNSPLAISTRKPRTPRKRPNQTYNEAAALLSTVYPKIFPAKHLLTKDSKFNTKAVLDTFLSTTDSLDLLLPFRVFDNSGFLLHQPIQEKPGFRIEPRVANCHENSCRIPVENDFLEDFDAESILDDEEIEEAGLDSILGNLNVENDPPVDESNAGRCGVQTGSSCYGFPMGLGFGGKFDFRFGMKRGVRALRNVDEGGDWWRFPTVNVTNMSSSKLNKAAATPTEKKKKKIEKPAEVIKGVDESPKENSIPRENDNSISKQEEDTTIPKLKKILKLNYDEVANAWSDRGSPFSNFSDEFPGQEQPGSDIHARLAEIDLFSENGGLREASVLRYKEKRRTRLFSKKIRYQVRKVNADRRPRKKGRFVRRSNSPMSDGGSDR